MIDADGVALLLLAEQARREHIGDQAVTVQIIRRRGRNQREGSSAPGIQHALGNHVTGERRVGGARRGSAIGENWLPLTQVVLLIDRAIVGGHRVGGDRLELVHHGLRQPAAGRIHQAAEIAVAHALGGQHAVLVQMVAAVVRLESPRTRRSCSCPL